MSRISQLESLRANDPQDADIPYMLAQEFAKAGDSDNAVRCYDECIALDQDYHYAYYHKAKTLESNGDAAAAAETLRVGLDKATAAGNAKAIGEIHAYLDALS